MNPRVAQGLAVSLSVLAGFVDALGYIATGGLFVAFMSGNSTVLGIAVAQWLSRTMLAGGLVAAFVTGVMIGTWIGRPFGHGRAPVVLVTMGVLLAMAAGLQMGDMVVPASLVIALAMGTENTVFQKEGVAGIGLTYMTGTLVRLGQKIAEACAGGPWGAVVPDTLLWLGMVAGAGLGSLAYTWMGLDGLWIAVGVSGVLAVVARVGLR